jgi:hypothetical protein
MTRFEQTYRWLKPIFERLIDIQKHNGLVFDDDELLGKIGINEEKHMIFAQSGVTKTVYYGDGWTDEKQETKTYWRQKLKKWRFVAAPCLQKVILK